MRKSQIGWSILAVVGLMAIAGSIWGIRSLHHFVTQDPKLCMLCHASTPEFAAWSKSGHQNTSCQQCHHTTYDDALSVLGSYIQGKNPDIKTGKQSNVQMGSCASCHISHDKNWPQVGASRGHRIHFVEQKIACTKCHLAGSHRFEPVAESCKGCHGKHTINVQGMQKMHCFACHDFLTAGKDLKPTRRSCLRCHQEKGVMGSGFPEKAPMQFGCSACHKPHAPPHEEILSCSTCHPVIGKAGLHSKPHHRDCKTCHKPHAWSTQREDCLRCHPNKATHNGHKACAECHLWQVDPKH